MSADNCGCDPEAHHRCERHTIEDLLAENANLTKESIYWFDLCKLREKTIEALEKDLSEQHEDLDNAEMKDMLSLIHLKEALRYTEDESLDLEHNKALLEARLYLGMREKS